MKFKLLISLIFCLGLLQQANADIIINEVNPGSPDSVELYNHSAAPINLAGYRLEIYSEFEEPFQFILPASVLAANSAVKMFTDSVTPPADYIGQNINWTAGGGLAVVLKTPSNTIIDFFIAGPPDVMGTLPLGISFDAAPFPLLSVASNTYQRQHVSNTATTFFARDWAEAEETVGSVNVHQATITPANSGNPQVIINEIFTGSPDSIELFNYGCDPINLVGFEVEIYSEFEAVKTFQIPSIQLLPGATPFTLQDSPSGDPNFLDIDTNINWVSNGGAAVVLRDAQDNLIDYVIQGDTILGGLPWGMLFSPSSLPIFSGSGLSYQRRSVSHSGTSFKKADWILREATVGDMNALQPSDPANCGGILDYLPAIISGATQNKP